MCYEIISIKTTPWPNLTKLAKSCIDVCNYVCQIVQACLLGRSCPWTITWRLDSRTALGSTHGMTLQALLDFGPLVQLLLSQCACSSTDLTQLAESRLVPNWPHRSMQVPAWLGTFQYQMRTELNQTGQAKQRHYSRPWGLKLQVWMFYGKTCQELAILSKARYISQFSRTLQPQHSLSVIHLSQLFEFGLSTPPCNLLVLGLPPLRYFDQLVT
jgi:hypothetical protein